ncbi:MAG: hypothetical protein E7526_06340 [Ruminococcaceae bacterium]|nr:hypothetical protein [Oscillospiraceae bacterium]
MFKIKFNDLNDLYEISMEISAISYLLRLVEIDTNENIISKGNISYISENTLSYLINKQYDSIEKLWALLDKEDFTK